MELSTCFGKREMQSHFCPGAPKPRLCLRASFTANRARVLQVCSHVYALADSMLLECTAASWEQLDRLYDNAKSNNATLSFLSFGIAEIHSQIELIRHSGELFTLEPSIRVEKVLLTEASRCQRAG